jgi:peptidyl-prolyl cis-trans isomerase SurA
MMNLYISIIGTLVALFFSYTFTGNQIGHCDDDVVVATILGEPVCLSKLNHHFNRNPVNDPDGDIQAQLQEFLPAYIYYRLKLLEGTEAGFHNDEDLLNEYHTFAREAAYSYWLDNTIKTDIINTYKIRMAEERKAFHILAELSSDAPVTEKGNVFRRMLEARDELLAGADPEDVNSRYSSVRNGIPMGGSLPWVTAGRTVREFEDALFALDQGEISMPVRTQFGYHIIYLEEIRNRSAERLVSHIFFHPAEDDSVKKRAEQAYRALSEGEDWNTVAEDYSMDTSSSSRGGNIGWVGYGMQFPEPFVDVVMQAGMDESFSEPIGMDYGYHIIKIDSVRTFENDEQINEYVMNQLERLQRLSPDRDDVYSHLRVAGNLKIDESLRSKIVSDAKTVTEIPEETHNEIFVTFFDEEIPLYRFIEFLETNNITEEINDEVFEEFITELIRESLILVTRQNHPEYRAAMAEFFDGLIVFKVNEEFIWNPDKMDRAALEQFYHDNIHRYQLKYNYTYYRFSSASDSTITEAYAALNTGELPDEIENRFPGIQAVKNSTRNPGSREYSILENLNTGDISDIESSGSLQYFYYLVEIENPRSMTFDEAFYRVANDYQSIHDETYFNKLMGKYQVELYPENI